MPVSLASMRDVLMPGTWVWSWVSAHKNEVLTKATLPSKRFPHLHMLWRKGEIKTIGDIRILPRNFTTKTKIAYQEQLESAGWEYPQGAGRVRLELEVRPEDLNAEGKVEVFRMKPNAARKALDAEIAKYFAWRSDYV